MSYINHRDFNRKAQAIRQTADTIHRVAQHLHADTTDIGEALQLMDAQKAAETVLSANLEGMPELTLNTVGNSLTSHHNVIFHIQQSRRSQGKNDGLSR